MYKNLVYTKILKSIKASKVIYDNVIVHLAGRGRGKEQGDGADTSDLHGNQLKVLSNHLIKMRCNWHSKSYSTVENKSELLPYGCYFINAYIILF